MGVFIFWLHYVIAFILLWHILRCIYVKKGKSDRWGNNVYERTEDDKRMKHPLWLVLVFIMVLFIPILNIAVFVPYLLFRALCERGDEKNPHYIKSIFTKQL